MEELKYGFNKTYNHEMNKGLLNLFSAMFNRNSGQTTFLFNLLGGDYGKLFDLEVRIKNCHVCFCPGDVEDVEEVMAMVPKSEWFNSDEQAKYLKLFAKN